jgi:hypothetical protein
MCASRAYKARKRQLVEDQVNEKFSMEEENRRKIDLSNGYVLTPRAAAAYLGLGKTTIYRYLSNGHVRIYGRKNKRVFVEDNAQCRLRHPAKTSFQTHGHNASLSFCLTQPYGISPAN